MLYWNASLNECGDWIKDAAVDETMHQLTLQLQATTKRTAEAADWRKMANERKSRVESARCRP